MRYHQGDTNIVEWIDTYYYVYTVSFMLYINILDTYFTINKKLRIMEINNTYTSI